MITIRARRAKPPTGWLSELMLRNANYPRHPLLDGRLDEVLVDVTPGAASHTPVVVLSMIRELISTCAAVIATGPLLQPTNSRSVSRL